jgi:CRISPR/Cas system-associated exonuclease Cas4 (RecB family)
MKLSKSRMLLYIQCPKKFYIEYIAGMKEYIEHPEEGSPLRIGIELHEIFENYYKLPEAKKVTKPYQKSIFDVLMTMPNADKYKMQINNFASFNAKIIEEVGVENYLPLAQELDLYDEGLDFRGIIDRVDIDPEDPDRHIIIDYKTGKMKAIHHYLLELSLYKILYERATGNKVSKVGIYFSKNNRLRSTEITDEDEDYALEVLHGIRKEIVENTENRVEFERRPSFLCNYCDYNENICNLEDLEKR